MVGRVTLAPRKGLHQGIAQNAEITVHLIPQSLKLTSRLIRDETKGNHQRQCVKVCSHIRVQRSDYASSNPHALGQPLVLVLRILGSCLIFHFTLHIAECLHPFLRNCKIFSSFTSPFPPQPATPSWTSGLTATYHDQARRSSSSILR